MSPKQEGCLPRILLSNQKIQKISNEQKGVLQKYKIRISLSKVWKTVHEKQIIGFVYNELS